jgi:hypothetical protein
MGVGEMKRRLAPLAAAAIGLLVSVALAEVVLRVATPMLPLAFLIYLNPALRDTSPRTQNAIRAKLPLLNGRREDPEVGWTNMPNIRKKGVNDEGESFETGTSPEGFYTPDYPDPSTKQIVTIGASFLSTFYVVRPVQSVLRDELHVPVYNVAAGGWGPESYRAAYLKFAAARRHDLVVVFTVPSDPSNVAYWNQWKAEAPSESFMAWMQKTSAATDALNHDTSWPNRHLVLWNLARFVMRRPTASSDGSPSGAVLTSGASRLEHFDSGGKGFDLQLELRQIFTENDPEYFLPGSSYYQVMEAYFESLLRLKADVEARHARMVLVWIPSKERVYIPVLPQTRRASYIHNRGDIDGLENVLAKFARQEGISFLDLTGPFVEQARSEQLFFVADGHWNSRGNALAGTLVANFIKQLPETPPQPMPVDPPLYVRKRSIDLDRRLSSASMNYHAAIVHDAAAGWTIRGRAEARFSYLARWNETSIDSPMWLVATGVVRRGGLTIGVLLNDKWAGQLNVDTVGPFSLALPVPRAGQYAVLVANHLPPESLETDAEITALGWAPISQTP